MKWVELGIRNFQPSASNESWAYAYDAVNQYIAIKEINYKQYLLLLRLISSKDTDPSFESEVSAAAQRFGILTKQQLSLIIQQFENYPIPKDDALLYASAAYVFISDPRENNIEKARQNLNQAIKLAEQYPGDKIAVANIGSLIAEMLGEWDAKEGQALRNRMDKLKTQAQREAYDMADSYLSDCMKAIPICPSEKLQVLEVDLAKAGFYGDFDTKDTAWLWGRLSYLIGVQKAESRDNRLRLLFAYANSAKTAAHRSELQRLQDKLQKTK